MCCLRSFILFYLHKTLSYSFLIATAGTALRQESKTSAAESSGNGWSKLSTYAVSCNRSFSVPLQPVPNANPSNNVPEELGAFKVGVIGPTTPVDMPPHQGFPYRLVRTR
jgi:hypothetical protein